jgi:KDO2-lipid IV(A) lauroyltransferase
MATENAFHPLDYLSPRYWPTWLGLLLLRLTILLPYNLLLKLASGLGCLLYALIPSRRHIAEVNVALCFPELDQEARTRLVKRNYASTVMALFESGLSWWGSDRRLRSLYRIEGLENYQTAITKNKGLLLLGGHYTTLEISGRLLAFHIDKVQPIYKRAHNALVDAIMTTTRRRILDDLLSNTDLRAIVRSLRKGKVVWYAPDQDFGRERSVFAPFMGVETATLTATARLAKLSGAPIVPFYSERLPGNQGYLIKILPELENFPSGDDVTDATLVNQVIEQQVRAAPEQYLWLHRRFKTRPEGEADLYKR